MLCWRHTLCQLHKQEKIKITLIAKVLNIFSVLDAQITCKNKCFVGSILPKATFSEFSRITIAFFISTIVTRNRDGLETPVVLIEIFKLCWNLPSGPKDRGSLQKNMAFLEGNKLFAGDFRANLDEANSDMVQFINSWNWKWIV